MDTNIGQVTHAGRGVVRTEGGLVVPASAVEDKRQRRVWMWQDWKNFRRVIKFFHQERIQMVLQCADCKTILVPKPAGEDYALECQCRVREIRPSR